MLTAKNFSVEPRKITVQGDEYIVESQSRLTINELNSGLYLTMNGTRTYTYNGTPNDSDSD